MRLSAVVALCVALIASSGVRQTAGPSVRFHHYHFRVPDPAASMNQAATSFKGTRVLLRGLGVGVRVGTTYALFDRVDASTSSAAARGTIEAAYDSARRWLSDQGVGVDSDADSARADLAAMFADEQLDHIAFTTADTSSVVSLLLSHGAKPIRQTDDSRLFRTD